MPKVNGDKAQQMLTDTIQNAGGWTWRAVPRKELFRATCLVVPHKTDAEHDAHFFTFFIRGKSSSGLFLLLELGNNTDLSKKPSVLPWNLRKVGGYLYLKVAEGVEVKSSPRHKHQQIHRERHFPQQVEQGLPPIPRNLLFRLTQNNQ